MVKHEARQLIRSADLMVPATSNRKISPEEGCNTRVVRLSQHIKNVCKIFKVKPKVNVREIFYS